MKGIPDDTIHGISTHSTGSNRGGSVRNIMHDSSTHSTASYMSGPRGRSGSNGGGLQTSSHGGSGLTGQSTHGAEEEEDSSDEDDDGFVVAPADKDHEKGTWLYSFTKK
ncbi:hypothetical protein EON65_35875 [archaeon]|nr:MAG: hypothetical protein EON65_35875 [archaeon]